jgi:hypothetical protein
MHVRIKSDGRGARRMDARLALHFHTLINRRRNRLSAARRALDAHSAGGCTALLPQRSSAKSALTIAPGRRMKCLIERPPWCKAASRGYTVVTANSCGQSRGRVAQSPRGAANRTPNIRHPPPRTCSSMMTAHTQAPLYAVHRHSGDPKCPI